MDPMGRSAGADPSYNGISERAGLVKTVLAGGELRFRPEAGVVGALKWPVLGGVGRW
jgi:hypothetical protein